MTFVVTRDLRRKMLLMNFMTITFDHYKKQDLEKNSIKFADLKINGLMTSLEEKVKLSFFAVPLVKHVLEEIISGATFSTRSAKTASTKITLERL